MIKLAPSILSADFSQLGNNIKAVENSGAHYLHIDVMDGMFVPNITIGIPVIKSIRTITDMTFDVHLMIVNPERYIEEFAKAGADIINIHIESTDKVMECLNMIRELGKIPAITIKPNTPVEDVYEYLEYVDMVLVMTVEPGFGGQGFIHHTLSKVEKLYDYIQNNNLKVEIQVDGGVTVDNVHNCINAGANIIVAGSSVFNNNNCSDNTVAFYNKFEELSQ